MARISGVEPEQASLLTRVAYWMTKRKVGRLITPIKIAAHAPRLLRGTGQMDMAQLALRTVEASLKALAGVKVALLIGCPF